MKKFLIGCGIVALVLVGLGIGATMLTVHYVKRSVGDTKRLKSVQTQLTAQYGRREDYAPAADWRLDPQRLERFLGVREDFARSAAPFSERLGELLEKANAAKDEAKPRGVLEKLRFGFAMARGGLGLANAGLAAATQRDSLLLAAEMGEGEDLYLFCLTAFAWLDWNPMQDPGARDFQQFTRLKRRDFDQIVEEYQDACRSFFLKSLQGQCSALQAKAGRTPEDEALLKQLLDAVERSRQERSHFPLQGALTPQQLAVLAPYEQRVRAILPSTSQQVLLEALAVTKRFETEHGHLRVDDRDP
jgi:hypothetical protein